MNTKSLLLIAVSALSFVLAASAATRFVDQNNHTPVPPYTTWLTAATNIQDAIDMAVAADTILVTNGVYQTGARIVYGMSNRVAVTRTVVVRSVNGPGVTSIVGYQVPDTTNGASAVRGAYVTNGAVLSGFTLTNGATQTSGSSSTNQSGGGVWCESPSALVTNCILVANSASLFGGGASRGMLNNCLLTGNSTYGSGGAAYKATLNNCTLTNNWAYNSGGGAYLGTLNNCLLTANTAYDGYGGGASGGTLNNCTLTENSAIYGGGIDSGTLTNCLVYYNTAMLGPNNCYNATGYYCCTTPLPDYGAKNTEAEPKLASTSHLSASSPCRAAGLATSASGADIDGEPWANPPSIGCDEYWSGSATGGLGAGLTVDFTNVAVGFSVSFRANVTGRPSASAWNFGDGTVISNQPFASHAWAGSGDYSVALRAYNAAFSTGVLTTLTIHVTNQPLHYVALGGSRPVAPYTSWATAATNIQDAVDVASVAGALILVSNGVYQSGSRAMLGRSNRVAVTKPLVVRSSNGPSVTSIEGYRDWTAGAPAAVRCVYLDKGAMLSGFTLRNGATQTVGDAYRQRSGGGVWCETSSVLVTNCVLVSNRASSFGGGTFLGTLNNCSLQANSADGGGGAAYAALNNCTLTGNSAQVRGGGTYAGVLTNCTLAGNAGPLEGGGAYQASLYNCTLTGNSAVERGGGAHLSSLYNCILYYNAENHNTSYLRKCCTTPLPDWSTDNFSDPPLFLDTNGWGNLRLQASSPCINAGNNIYAPSPTDLDGNPRVSGGTVDVGAYEFQFDPFHAWLLQYSLAFDGSADYADTDGDGLNNWQEWIAGTDPTKTTSTLRIQSATGSASGVTVTWSSVTNRSYALEQAVNLDAAPAFSVLQTNIPGLAGATGWTDTNTASSTQRFYRVRVER